MQNTKGLLGVEANEVLAVLARENGYTGYLKFDVLGELNGFRSLDDDDLDALVADGVVVVDARSLEESGRARLSYLNTLSPQSDAGNGPAGKHRRAPVEFWLSVLAASGAVIHNAEPLPLSSAMFTPQYADRIRSEGMEIRESGMFSVPKSANFTSVSGLVSKLGNLNMEARKVRDGERVINEMINLVTGEAIIAELKGLTGHDAIKSSASKLADRIDNVEKTIAKVPLLKDKLPLNTIFESAKLINQAVSQKVEITKAAPAPELR